MKYPYPFLQYWYGTFPLAQQETTPTDRVKAVSTTNLIRHVTDMTNKCTSHSSVDAVAVLKNASPNYVTVGGESQQMHTFAESFTHHVDLLWAHGGDLSWNMIHTNEDFQQYVRSF